MTDTAAARVEIQSQPEGGALVFELTGWDIIARAQAAGFRDAFMRFMISAEHGVLSEHIGGVLILGCQK